METVPVYPTSGGSVAVPVKKEGFLSRLFGHFSRGAFWEDLLALLVRESVSALISAVGGALMTIASERRSVAAGRVRESFQHPQTVADRVGNSPSAAFQGGYTPRPAYHPSYPQSAPPPVASVPPLYPGT